MVRPIGRVVRRKRCGGFQSSAGQALLRSSRSPMRRLLNSRSQRSTSVDQRERRLAGAALTNQKAVVLHSCDWVECRQCFDEIRVFPPVQSYFQANEITGVVTATHRDAPGTARDIDAARFSASPWNPRTLLKVGLSSITTSWSGKRACMVGRNREAPPPVTTI